MCAIFCGRQPARVEDITIQHFLAHDEPQIPAHSGRIYHFNILIDKYNIKRRYSNKIWPLPAYIVTICQLSSFYYKDIIMKRMKRYIQTGNRLATTLQVYY